MGFQQHKTIDSLLARGEKLDSLVEKSTDLSMASQVSRLNTTSGEGVAHSQERIVAGTIFNTFQELSARGAGRHPGFNAVLRSSSGSDLTSIREMIRKRRTFKPVRLPSGNFQSEHGCLMV